MKKILFTIVAIFGGTLLAQDQPSFWYDITEGVTYYGNTLDTLLPDNAAGGVSIVWNFSTNEFTYAQQYKVEAPTTVKAIFEYQQPPLFKQYLLTDDSLSVLEEGISKDGNIYFDYTSYTNPLTIFSTNPVLYTLSTKDSIAGIKYSDAGESDYHFKGLATSTIDAVGTVILPGDLQYEHVSRVKIKKEIVRDFSAQNHPDDTVVEYAYMWFLPGPDKYPLLVQDEERLVYNSNTLLSLTDDLKNEPGFSVFPNITSGTITCNYVVNKNSKVTFHVTDALGRKVLNLNESNKAAGAYTENFELDGLPAGIYNLELSINDRPLYKKIIIQ